MNTLTSDHAEVQVGEEWHRAAASALRSTASAHVQTFLSDHPYPLAGDKNATIRANYPPLSSSQKDDDHPYALGWVLTRETVERLNEVVRQTANQKADPEEEMWINSLIVLRKKGGFKNFLLSYADPREDTTTANTPWAEQVVYDEVERSEGEGRVPTVVIAYTNPEFAYRQRMSQASYEWLGKLLGEPRWLRGFHDNEAWAEYCRDSTIAARHTSQAG